MELLVGHNKKVLEQLDNEKETLQGQLTEISSTKAINKFNLTLDKSLGWKKDLQKIKTKIFASDLNDVQQNRVYRWRQRGNFRRGSRTSSISSASSSQGDVGKPYNRSMTTRFKGKHKRYDDDAKNGGGKKKQDTGAQAGNDLQVINLSTHELSETDVMLLQKGLTFSPYTTFIKFTAVKDLHVCP